MPLKQYSICVDPPYFYYLDEDNAVKRGTGFNSSLTKIDFPGLNAGKMSVDNATGTFYFFKYPDMFTCKEGGSPLKIPAFGLISGNNKLFYRNNEFLTIAGLDANFFVKFSFDGTKTQVVQSYDIIPGYSEIDNFSTDGKNIWISALNNKTGEYQLLKIDLE